jgi:choline dehydrogenase
VTVRYHWIVIGGGTAGAVVAAKLAQGPGRRVLLLEAGEAQPDAPLPDALAPAGFPVLEGFNWPYEAHARDLDSGPTVAMAYPMAKILGGGSAINGSVAMHARREDYDRWACLGDPDWSWEAMTPWRSRVDRIACADSTDHDRSGSAHDGWDLGRAFVAACAARGFPVVDLKSDGNTGVGTVPHNADHGRRRSTASLYLRDAIGRDTGLTVLGHCEVLRLIVEPAADTIRATAVEVATGQGVRRFEAEEFVLCAGAIGSPTVLARSGIGPPGSLERAGVRVRLALPGVGQGLQDHPVVSLWTRSERTGTAPPLALHQGMLQFASGGGTASCDLQIFALAGIPTAHLPGLDALVGAGAVCGLSSVLAAPESAGRVDFELRDGRLSPRIVLNLLGSEHDLARMMTGVRLAWDLISEAPLEGLLGRPLSCSRRVIDSDAMLVRMLRVTARASWHPVGTLRMGSQRDPMAVADARGRLHGCDNVFVADASLMPAIPRVPTNLSCMVIGERIAAHLRERAG